MKNVTDTSRTNVIIAETNMTEDILKKEIAIEEKADVEAGADQILRGDMITTKDNGRITTQAAIIHIRTKDASMS